MALKAQGQRVIPGNKYPVGYMQLTALGTTAKSIATATGGGAVPDDTYSAIIQAEAQDVRYRDDGVAPTALVGMILKVGVPIEYTGNLLALKFFEVTSGGIINISFYK